MPQTRQLPIHFQSENVHLCCPASVDRGVVSGLYGSKRRCNVPGSWFQELCMVVILGSSILGFKSLPKLEAYPMDRYAAKTTVIFHNTPKIANVRRTFSQFQCFQLPWIA